ncbi:hypothetical protein H5410_059531 [Solanum commersonii]|uniref:Uncharacterized protein n=1 Tax=Solanum commersonii TaxID=4109 RepID=A0A9J5W2P6_SOLCO|nr:hypothetical protein H5410_059531 [Solanum commersonii]
MIGNHEKWNSLRHWKNSMVFQIERINYSGGHIGMGSFQSNLLIFQPIIQTSRLQTGLGDISGKSKPLQRSYVSLGW